MSPPQQLLPSWNINVSEAECPKWRFWSLKTCVSELISMVRALESAGWVRFASLSPSSGWKPRGGKKGGSRERDGEREGGEMKEGKKFQDQTGRCVLTVACSHVRPAATSVSVSTELWLNKARQDLAYQHLTGIQRSSSWADTVAPLCPTIHYHLVDYSVSLSGWE